MVPGGNGVKSSNPRWALSALRRSFVWKGRARRAEMWWCMAFFWLVPTLLSFLPDVLALFSMAGGAATNWMTTISISLFCFGLLPGVSCAIRRLHDLDRSGYWWLMLLFLTLLGVCILLYWFVQRGTIGDNRYGPDPLMVE
jgi:uncharacterized membrane protein YhaH (DUF805 family)